MTPKAIENGNPAAHAPEPSFGDSIKVVAFDCDGVLFDSRKANRAYYDGILAHLGMAPMTGAQFEYAHMHTVDESLTYLIGDGPALEKAHQYRQQMSYMPFIRFMEMEPHLKDLLARLRPRFRTAIATNRTDTMDRVLTEHGLKGDFDLVISACDVTHPKPHPESLNAVIHHFNIQPGQMIYVGDSRLDQQAALAAGVPFVAFGNPDLDARWHLQWLNQLEPLLGIG